MGKDNLMNLWYNALTRMMLRLLPRQHPRLKHFLVELKNQQVFLPYHTT